MLQIVPESTYMAFFTPKKFFYFFLSNGSYLHIDRSRAEIILSSRMDKKGVILAYYFLIFIQRQVQDGFYRTAPAD